MTYPVSMNWHRNRNSLLSISRARLVLCLAICCGSQLRAWTDTASAMLRIHSNEGKVVEYHAYPEARATMLFPSADAWLEGEVNPDKWGLSASPILNEIHLLRVSDMQRRFTVVGAALGKQLFIFDGLFCNENSGVMSELILATHSAPSNDAEALNLAELYLTLSYYQLDDPAKFVAIRGSEPRQKDDLESPRTFSDGIGVSHSPQVSHKDGAYSVDLYTFSKSGVTIGPVTHWKMDLAASRFDEQLAAQHSGPQKLPPEGTTQKNDREKRIKFTVDIMANGFTNDGAQTDIQSWSASNGPGLSRVHYYYHAHQNAEKLFQDFLQNAVAMLGTGPWKFEDRRVAGKQALVVSADKDKQSLSATQLYEDETSVIAITCSCLSNLLASQGKDHTDNQH